jgi:hypothetical protein
LRWEAVTKSAIENAIIVVEAARRDDVVAVQKESEETKEVAAEVPSVTVRISTRVLRRVQIVIRTMSSGHSYMQKRK